MHTNFPSVRERNYLSWSKFFALITVLSATMFLDIQIQETDNQSQNYTGLISSDPDTSFLTPGLVNLAISTEMSLSSWERAGPSNTPSSQHAFMLENTVTVLQNHLESNKTSMMPSKSTSRRTHIEDLILGSLYFLVAFLSWILSTFDYFKLLRELESEHTYLDECEGHSHPLVTVLSIFICFMVLATVILLLVEHEIHT